MNKSNQNYKSYYGNTSMINTNSTLNNSNNGNSTSMDSQNV